MPGFERPQSPVSGNYSHRSIFSQGPAFTLDTFSSQDFIVKDFVESLSDSAVPQSRRSGPSTQAFDPRPLIRTFEHALHRLEELSGDLVEKETELSTAVRRAEAQHTSNIQNLSARLQDSLQNFGKLENERREYVRGGEAGSGGNQAVKIGEKLEDLDRQRVRADDARFLIQCWLEVSEKGELFQLQDRQRRGGDQRIKCAQIARQLLKLSQRLDPTSWAQTNGNKGLNGLNGVNGADSPSMRHNTREVIEKFSESLEKDLLRQFDEFAKRDRFDGMRECADVLQDFGGGSSVIGTFVNQHSFFIDRSQLVTEEIEGDPEMWEQLADPDSEAPGVEPSLQSLVDEVKIVVQEESSIIKKAFSYYETVMARFLQRIFQQSIQQKLEQVLDKAEGVSALAFLRSLQASRNCLSSLVDDLKSHGLTEHPEALSMQTSNVLDQQFDDLFVPYFAGSSYIEREKRNLEELYSSLLFKFTVYHSRKRKAPTTILASLAKSGSELLTSAREAYVDRLDSSDLAPQQKARLLRVAGLKDNESARKQMETEFNEQDGVINTANAKRMLRWLAEAVGRGLEIGGGSETPRDVLALLDLLLTHMGTQYVMVALDASNDAAATQENAKNEPDLSHLENVHAIINVMHLMLACINTVLLPLASSNTSVRRDVEKKTNAAMGQMEDKVNSLMQRTIDITISWVSKLLARQQKTDFRPKEDSVTGGGSWLEQLQTPTCQAIFAFLTRVHNLANNALSPSPNLSAFLTEIAVNVRTLLFDHFKKFTVSAMGGIMVTKDLSKYNELFRAWNLDESFDPSLEVMTEIGNIFVIGPDALRERLRGKQGVLGGAWEKGDMRPYVLRREDANTVGVQSVLSAL